MKPHQVTRCFEAALCEYTGAPYAVAVSSCTMALLLAVAWHLREYHRSPYNVLGDTIRHHPSVDIPKRTYVSVPQSIIHAGGRPTFRDEEWLGSYQLKPLPVWDSARWFTSSMYHSKALNEHPMTCVSFHVSKTLGDTQGGAILHDSPEADAWLRRARFDGRSEGVAPKDDHFDILGYHAYLSPDVSARLLWHLSTLPKHNAPLPNDNFPDLSTFEIFK